MLTLIAGETYLIKVSENSEDDVQAEFVSAHLDVRSKKVGFRFIAKSGKWFDVGETFRIYLEQFGDNVESIEKVLNSEIDKNNENA